MARSRISSRRSSASRPLIVFLLVSSFGILFAGCGSDTVPEPEVFRFTADDVARFRDLVGDGSGDTLATGTGGIAAIPRLEPMEGSGSGSVTLDLSQVRVYDAIRSGPGATGDTVYRVTNAYLNVRAEPRITAPEVVRLEQGATLAVDDFIDGAWAKVSLADGREGYVAHRYIAKLVSEDSLAAEREKFAGLYFVNFSFLNVRSAPDSQSEKIGELAGQSLVRPLSIDGAWARVPFEGGDGYVSSQYLTPFAPNFLVRQSAYTLPILQFNAEIADAPTRLRASVAALKNAGVQLITLRDFYDMVLRQEERDVRLQPRSAVLAVSGLTSENVDAISDALVAAGARATLFVETGNLGISGITEKDVLTLQANGNDIQSAGHTGDDLRSLTNAQMELELGQSRSLLEEYTGRSVFAIAYPAGGVNDRVLQKAGEAGYLFGIGAAPERIVRREQFLRMPSFALIETMTDEDIVRIVLPE